MKSLWKTLQCSYRMSQISSYIFWGILLAFLGLFVQQAWSQEKALCTSFIGEEEEHFFYLESRDLESQLLESERLVLGQEGGSSWWFGGEVFYWTAQESQGFYGDQCWLYGKSAGPQPPDKPEHYIFPTRTLFTEPRRSPGFSVSAGLRPQENGWGIATKATFFKQDGDWIFQGTSDDLLSAPKTKTGVALPEEVPLWVLFNHSFLGENHFTYIKNYGYGPHFFTDKVFWHTERDFRRIDATFQGEGFCTPTCGVAVLGGLSAVNMEVTNIAQVASRSIPVPPDKRQKITPLETEHTSATQGIGPRVGVAPSIAFGGFSLYGEFFGGVLASLWQEEKVVLLDNVRARTARMPEPKKTTWARSGRLLSAFFDVELGVSMERVGCSSVYYVAAGMNAHLFLRFLVNRVNQSGEKVFGDDKGQILLLSKTQILFQDLFVGGGFLRASVAF